MVRVVSHWAVKEPPSSLAILRMMASDNLKIGRVAARIRLVIANDQRFVFTQPRNKGFWQARVDIPQNADMPGPLDAVEDRGETMDRDDNRRLVGPTQRAQSRELLVDRLVVGMEQRVEAHLPLVLAQAFIAGYPSAVALRQD